LGANRPRLRDVPGCSQEKRVRRGEKERRRNCVMPGGLGKKGQMGAGKTGASLLPRVGRRGVKLLVLPPASICTHEYWEREG